MISTRRARIKAITSLPVRRKNAENANNTKNKQPSKECINKTPKSPRTPRRVLQTQEEDQKSPVIKTASPGTNPYETSSVIVCKTLNEDPYPCEVKVSVESPKGTSTPQRAAKVSVITPNLNYKPHASIPSCGSPPRDVASTLLLSPKVSSKPVAVIVPRPVTPNRGRTPAAHTIDENNELHITSLHVNSVNYNNAASKSVVPDDYNVPSVPESIPESVENEGVMDGIVPLQAKKNAPKPIDLLKNEIISENAEVLFDPIIPLPSPSKVRPKLRPTPRLGPLRRSSIQGSASESEEENRRAQLCGAATPGLVRQRRHSQASISNSVLNRDTNRTRNDSVCSSASQGTATTGTSPVKEKTSSKTKRREVCRRMAEVRRRRETIKRETLTMYDLIFYNPMTNPLIPNQDEIKAKEESIKDEMERKMEEKKKEEKPVKKLDADSAPVPQIKLGANGEIIIDKESLVIDQTDAKRDVSTVVREGSWGSGNGKYTRAPRTADWSGPETVRFYRALAALGTDFSLMAGLFPDRTRRDLKLKFKKEEKLNSPQVDKALKMGNAWDPSILKKEFDNEREEAAKIAMQNAEKLKMERLKERERIKGSREVRVRNSRAARALQSTMLPGVCDQKEGEINTIDDLVNRARMKKSKTKKVPVDPRPPTEVPTTPSMATLTLVNDEQMIHDQTQVTDNMATISRVNTPVQGPPLILNALTNMAKNIEAGSLVVLTVNDPASPSKKVLQTYIAQKGKLTSISLTGVLLSSVLDYMKKGTPMSTMSSNSSPLLTSPTSSVVSQDSRASVTTPQSNANPSPDKRRRMGTYTMTQL